MNSNSHQPAENTSSFMGSSSVSLCGKERSSHERRKSGAHQRLALQHLTLPSNLNSSQATNKIFLKTNETFLSQKNSTQKSNLASTANYSISSSEAGIAPSYQHQYLPQNVQPPFYFNYPQQYAYQPFAQLNQHLQQNISLDVSRRNSVGSDYRATTPFEIENFLQSQYLAGQQQKAARCGDGEIFVSNQEEELEESRRRLLQQQQQVEQQRNLNNNSLIKIDEQCQMMERSETQKDINNGFGGSLTMRADSISSIDNFGGSKLLDGGFSQENPSFQLSQSSLFNILPVQACDSKFAKQYSAASSAGDQPYSDAISQHHTGATSHLVVTPSEYIDHNQYSNYLNQNIQLPQIPNHQHPHPLAQFQPQMQFHPYFVPQMPVQPQIPQSTIPSIHNSAVLDQSRASTQSLSCSCTDCLQAQMAYLQQMLIQQQQLYLQQQIAFQNHQQLNSSQQSLEAQSPVCQESLNYIPQQFSSHMQYQLSSHQQSEQTQRSVSESSDDLQHQYEQFVEQEITSQQVQQQQSAKMVASNYYQFQKKNYIDLPLGEIPEMKESFYEDQSRISCSVLSKQQLRQSLYGSLVLQPGAPVPQQNSSIAYLSSGQREDTQQQEDDSAQKVTTYQEMLSECSPSPNAKDSSAKATFIQHDTLTAPLSGGVMTPLKTPQSIFFCPTTQEKQLNTPQSTMIVNRDSLVKGGFNLHQHSNSQYNTNLMTPFTNQSIQIYHDEPSTPRSSDDTIHRLRQAMNGTRSQMIEGIDQPTPTQDSIQFKQIRYYTENSPDSDNYQQKLGNPCHQTSQSEYDYVKGLLFTDTTTFPKNQPDYEENYRQTGKEFELREGSLIERRTRLATEQITLTNEKDSFCLPSRNFKRSLIIGSYEKEKEDKLISYILDSDPYLQSAKSKRSRANESIRSSRNFRSQSLSRYNKLFQSLGEPSREDTLNLDNMGRSGVTFGVSMNSTNTQARDQNDSVKLTVTTFNPLESKRASSVDSEKAAPRVSLGKTGQRKLKPNLQAKTNTRSLSLQQPVRKPLQAKKEAAKKQREPVKTKIIPQQKQSTKSRASSIPKPSQLSKNSTPNKKESEAIFKRLSNPPLTRQSQQLQGARPSSRQKFEKKLFEMNELTSAKSRLSKRSTSTKKPVPKFDTFQNVKARVNSLQRSTRQKSMGGDKLQQSKHEASSKQQTRFSSISARVMQPLSAQKKDRAASQTSTKSVEPKLVTININPLKKHVEVVSPQAEREEPLYDSDIVNLQLNQAPPLTLCNPFTEETCSESRRESLLDTIPEKNAKKQCKYSYLDEVMEQSDEIVKFEIPIEHSESSENECVARLDTSHSSFSQPSHNKISQKQETKVDPHHRSHKTKKDFSQILKQLDTSNNRSRCSNMKHVSSFNSSHQKQFLSNSSVQRGVKQGRQPPQVVAQSVASSQQSEQPRESLINPLLTPSSQIEIVQQSTNLPQSTKNASQSIKPSLGLNPKEKKSFCLPNALFFNKNLKASETPKQFAATATKESSSHHRNQKSVSDFSPVFPKQQNESESHSSAVIASTPKMGGNQQQKRQFIFDQSDESSLQETTSKRHSRTLKLDQKEKNSLRERIKEHKNLSMSQVTNQTTCNM